MRKLQFRLWDSEDKEMYYGVDIEEMRLRDLNDNCFLQYTGHSLILDKSKKVYEGDLLGTFNGILYEVYFSDSGEWRVRFWNTDHKGQDQGSLANILYNDYIKLKGNIHQHPELLK